MASITNEKNGRKTIQFYHPDGTRKSLRLGKTTKRHAEAVKVKVESLVFSLKSGHSPDDETALWLSKLERAIIEKLAAVGLIPEPKFAQLKEFTDEYIQKRRSLDCAKSNPI